jgi:hypothetical protein
LAKVDVDVGGTPSLIFDCLDNTAVATSAETIPFCKYYTLDGSTAGSRYYCKDN